MWLFFAVPWDGMQYVIVIFPDYTHLLLYIYKTCQTMEAATNNELLTTDHRLGTDTVAIRGRG